MTRRWVDELLVDLHLEDEPEAPAYLAVCLITLVCFLSLVVIVLAVT